MDTFILSVKNDRFILGRVRPYQTFDKIEMSLGPGGMGPGITGEG